MPYEKQPSLTQDSSANLKWLETRPSDHTQTMLVVTKVWQWKPQNSVSCSHDSTLVWEVVVLSKCRCELLLLDLEQFQPSISVYRSCLSLLFSGCWEGKIGGEGSLFLALIRFFKCMHSLKYSHWKNSWRYWSYFHSCIVNFRYWFFFVPGLDPDILNACSNVEGSMFLSKLKMVVNYI